MVIIEGTEGVIRRGRKWVVGGRGGSLRPWRCFRNLIASTFAHLRAVASICLRNGLPAGGLGSASGAL